MKNIGFRIDDEQPAELQRRAASVHKISRRLTLKALEADRESELVRRELRKIGGNVSDLRDARNAVSEHRRHRIAWRKPIYRR